MDLNTQSEEVNQMNETNEITERERILIEKRRIITERKRLQRRGEILPCFPTQKELCLNIECEVCNPRRFYFTRFAKNYSPKNEINILSLLKKCSTCIILECENCHKDWSLKVVNIVKLYENSHFCKDCNSQFIQKRNLEKKNNCRK